MVCRVAERRHWFTCARLYAGQSWFSSPRSLLHLAPTCSVGIDGPTSSSSRLAATRPKSGVVLPTASVGMAPTPGRHWRVCRRQQGRYDRCRSRRRVIHRYTKEGLLIGSFKSAPRLWCRGFGGFALGRFRCFSALHASAFSHGCWMSSVRQLVCDCLWRSSRPQYPDTDRQRLM